MKTDAEVRRLMRERARGKTQEQAAARAGMSVRTARNYERAGALPSQLKAPRAYRTRPNPFADAWPWVVAELERDPALQATTLFELLCEREPGRYRPTQLRTLQRQIAAWRLERGPEREVYFPQVHRPGVAAQSDFTRMDDLGVSLGGAPFPHLAFHLVFPYSNVEAVHLCPSESFEALAEGLEACLWRLGGVPRQHRTDHLGAAIRPLDAAGQAEARERYAALMAHYGMEPTVNNAGEAHENGDVEQAHHRLKQAVDQALRVRGSRDFPGRAAYGRFLHALVGRRNAARGGRWAEEQAALRPLPALPLAPCREVRVTVGRFSTIYVLRNTYSVPSRLIGAKLLVRARAEMLELYRGTARLLTLERLRGQGRHRIDYRHVIWSLARKPGAFANYRYRDELFPTLAFRRAYDALAAAVPTRADREYVRVLHLAASTAESEVEAALGLLLERGEPPTVDAVRELVRVPGPAAVPELTPAALDLAEQRRQRLFAFIERLVQWENSTDEGIVGTARRLILAATDGNPPPVLDPFCGGGSIPLEAQRLGMAAHASDLNPVAVLITKALIEIPPKFAGLPPVNPESRRTATGVDAPWKGAAGLAADVRYYGKWMRDEAERRIGHLYPKVPLPKEHGGGEATVIAWLWARTVTCPNPACGARMPLVSSFWLSKKPGKQAWVKPTIDRSVKPPAIRFTVSSGQGQPLDDTVNRRGARCIACGSAVPFTHVRAEGKAGRMGAQLMAIVAEGKGGRIYLPPDDAHAAIATSAMPTWKPDFPLPHNPRDFKTPNYGMTTFADLFTPRQLVALTSFSDLVGEARARVHTDALAAGLADDEAGLEAGGTGATAYADAVAVYLAFAVDRAAESGCTLASHGARVRPLPSDFQPRRGHGDGRD